MKSEHTAQGGKTLAKPLTIVCLTLALARPLKL